MPPDGARRPGPPVHSKMRFDKKHDRSYFYLMDSRPHATRAKILERGLDLMSQVGLSGVTLGVLATDAGMSKSGLFAHFRSKAAVQLALLQQMARVANAAVVAPAM